MPRLFPSLGRSREVATPPHYQFNEGYSNQYAQDTSNSNIPSWRRPFSRKKNQKWPEEFVEYPSRAVSYAEGYAPSIGSNTQYRRPTIDDYLDDDDDTLAGENTYYATDSSQPGPIPLVQRENSFHSSFSRLQDAFSDRRGHASQAVTELPLPTPTQTHRHSTDFPSPPHLQVPQAGHGVGPSGLQPTSEHHGSFFVPQHPVLINNTGIDSVRPDIVHPDPGHGPSPILHNMPRQPEYSERPDYGYDDRQRTRSERRRTNSHHRSRGSLEDYRFEMYTDHGKISDFQPDEDYPPCVVVVKRARRKEDDTYYLLPGGAPVIFTDENGNELKRVGDFSGRYTPQPMRPVIIKDEEDREIYRAWFDDDDSESSSLSRSEDSFYSSARHGGRHDHHDREYYDQDQEYRRDKYAFALHLLHVGVD
ncbi:hypothetical protein C8Q75DRAFT_271107 [Abortiporus biennis]|nr:hypothetical protein C8Q75DRAFT_271107 [Abortiporus biennis]